MTNIEPVGPSEFSWGRGLQPPPEEGAVPSNYEKLRALYRNDKSDRNLDAGATADYEDYIRE